MRCGKYWIEDDTLIIEGKFFGISTGLLGGWKRVRHVFNNTVKDESLMWDPLSYLRSVAKKFGLRNYFGLLTSVPMDRLYIAECEEVTAFTTAGVLNPNEKVQVGTINIILVLDCRLPRSALLNAIITATEAKSKALIEKGYNFTGTSTDAVIILTSERGKYYKYSGPASELGKKIWMAVIESVSGSIDKWK